MLSGGKHQTNTTWDHGCSNAWREVDRGDEGGGSGKGKRSKHSHIADCSHKTSPWVSPLKSLGFCTAQITM